MKVIIGLGNPGIKYLNNRHSVGHMVIDKLSPMVKGQRLMVKKTNTFMNNSGSFVLALSKTYNLLPKDLFIIHDDLDIKLGEYKIQLGKGPKKHKGLNDIYEKLKTKNFWHVRVGIDNRLQGIGDRLKGEQYVLEDFNDQEKQIINETINRLSIDLIEKLKINNLCNQLVV